MKAKEANKMAITQYSTHGAVHGTNAKTERSLVHIRAYLHDGQMLLPY